MAANKNISMNLFMFPPGKFTEYYVSKRTGYFYPGRVTEYRFYAIVGQLCGERRGAAGTNKNSNSLYERRCDS
jgi:hypothetical protein